MRLTDKEVKEWWEAITNTLTVHQGPLEKPPRVLSFDELQNLQHSRIFVWLEDLIKNEIKGCELISGISNHDIVSIFSGGYYSLLRKNYGKKYQCWTAYPGGAKCKILI